jgi:hypothetical protein
MAAMRKMVAPQTGEHRLFTITDLRVHVAPILAFTFDRSACSRSAKIRTGGCGKWGSELVQIAAHGPKFFDPMIPNTPDFIPHDEESSGLIDARSVLGAGWFLFDVQAHKLSSDPERVEGGQLLAMFVDPEIGRGPGDGDDEDDDGEDDS